jgi:hypothetical protein
MTCFHRSNIPNATRRRLTVFADFSATIAQTARLWKRNFVIQVMKFCKLRTGKGSPPGHSNSNSLITSGLNEMGGVACRLH